MDSLTQIVIGIATADLCAGKVLRRKTYLYGALLGTLPDLDVAVGLFMDPVNGMAIHRGVSHSLLLFLFLSPVLGLLISKLENNRITFKSAVFLVFCCLATHVIIDLFTSWGTQVFWPLSHRVAFKTIFVVDPLYTLPLLISLIVAWRKKVFNMRRKYILWGLYISSAYLLLTCGIKLYALHTFKKALKSNNIEYTNLIVKPTAFNCILWNANVATDDAYYLSDYSVFDYEPAHFVKYSKNNTYTNKLTGNADFEKLKTISEGWFIVTKHDGSYYFNDLRFGLLTNNAEQPQFAFSYVFKPIKGQLRAVEVPKQKRDGKVLLKRIISRIWYGNTDI